MRNFNCNLGKSFGAFLPVFLIFAEGSSPSGKQTKLSQQNSLTPAFSPLQPLSPSSPRSPIIDTDLFPPNHAPSALSKNYLGQMDRTLSYELKGKDVDGNTLTFSIVTPTSNGSLGQIETINATAAKVLYTPLPGFQGLDQFSFQVSDGTVSSNLADVTIQVQPTLRVWTEVNLPTYLVAEPPFNLTEEDGALPGMTQLDFTIASLEDWSKITHEMVVTTTPGNVEYTYPSLVSAANAFGMKIIGGIKTIQSFPQCNTLETWNITDPDSWALVAEDLWQIVQMTGVNKVYLENESLLLPHYWTGIPSVDYDLLEDILKETLRPLDDANIEIIFWMPQLAETQFANGVDMVAETTQFLQAIHRALPNARFNTTYLSRFFQQYDVEGITYDQMIEVLGGGQVGQHFVMENLWTCRTGIWYREDGTYAGRVYSPVETMVYLGMLGGEYLQPNQLWVLDYWERPHTNLLHLYVRGFDFLKIAEDYANLYPEIGAEVSVP